MRLALHKSLNDPERIDHILDSRFFYRRRILIAAKTAIGSLSRRIETDWHMVKFGNIDKIGVQLLAEVKQVLGYFLLSRLENICLNNLIELFLLCYKIVASFFLVA